MSACEPEPSRQSFPSPQSPRPPESSLQTVPTLPPPSQSRAEEKRAFANHARRQFMEYLRGRGWVKESTLPQTTLIARLLEQGWIEQQRQPPKNEIFYRMTDVGLKASKGSCANTRAEGEVEMLALSEMQYPHWLMVAGAGLVALGFVGYAFRQNRRGKT